MRVKGLYVCVWQLFGFLIVMNWVFCCKSEALLYSVLVTENTEIKICLLSMYCRNIQSLSEPMFSSIGLVLGSQYM